MINKVFIWLPCTLIVLLMSYMAGAQSLGDAVVHITFGAGTSVHSGALPADSGTTSYTYSSNDFPTDGSYTIENTTAGAGQVWWSTTDHTGNTGGYMMIVNASVSKTDYFYQREVDGLCGGTTYQFSAWAGNLLRSEDLSPPNITFGIYNLDGSLIQSYSTGQIALTPSGFKWVNFSFNFTLPAGTGNVIIKMTNNANGGAPANDLALDDITFSPYGSTVSAVFNSSTSTSETSCAGTAQTYTINTTSTLASGYLQKLQLYENGTWTDISAASTASTYTITSPTAAGTYHYRLVSATTANIGSPSCVVSSNSLTITVSAAPVASFTKTNAECLGTATVFTDQSTSTPAITGWLWDFGDGQTSTLQNPSHIYTAPGSFQVKLTVTNSNGCMNTSATQTVLITAQAVAAFSHSTPDCTGQPVTFTNGSTSADGSITKWIWTYGDGDTETLTTGLVHTHTYASAGTYSATLQVETASGCLSNIAAEQVIINPLPVVDFLLPDACLTDDVQFTNETTIADGTQAGLTYLWNFGDPNATPEQPNTSVLANPTHKYSEAGNYTVTLVVTSSSGCVSAKKSELFTVNGAVPKAAFTVENSGNLCSSDAVVIDNASTVDFGSITKIEIFYDLVNSPSVSSVYYKDLDQIPADGKFYHSYGTFNSPVSKNYEIRMIASSGASCISVPADQTITVNANPVVTVSTIGTVCQGSAAVQISTNSNGFAGTGVFSGTGVSSTGLFDPSASGAFTISYLFTDQSGCTFASLQVVTVNAAPSISIPSTYTILAGGQTKLEATANGDSLTYRWSPSTGLSDSTILDPVASPLTDTKYTLTATAITGCTAVATVEVQVLQSPVIPNTFTPNGDGINDTWAIQYLDSYPGCAVSIYNRYGTRLFYSVGYPNAWDGRYNGVVVPSGAYYYIIDPKHGRAVISGCVMIIR